MEKRSQIYRRIVFLLAAALIQSPITLAFAPRDNFLLKCGASTPATLDDRRVFVSDESDLLSSCKSHGISDSQHSDATPDIYRSARVFHDAASYRFRIKDRNAVHFIRLHFYALNSSSYDLSAARFHVSAGGFVLLSNFSLAAEGKHSIMKEFMMKVKSNDLTVTFIPADAASIAFVNAIEVFSAPNDLISNLAWSKSDNNFKNWNILEQALQSMYRINIGGGKITPFNDTLWRTWTPSDTEFLQPATSPSRLYTFSGRIEYFEGGASREVAPDHVYRSSRVTNSSMTWIFPLNSDHMHLLRLHFCDIISLSLNQLYFNIIINDELVYKDFDLSEATAQTLSSPYYIDFVINSNIGRTLKISIIPSNRDFPANHLGLLNGLEIFKINNTAGSLDGMISVHEIYDNHTRGGFYMFLNSMMCGSMIAVLIVAALILVKLLRKETRRPLAWLPLPVVDADEGKQVSGKSTY